MNQKVPRVYFDANILIDLAKRRMKMHDPARENDLWFFSQMLKASELGEMRLYTSALTIAECVHAGNVGGLPDLATQDFFTGVLLSGTMVTLVQCSVFVAEYARDLRWKHGLTLKPMDSLHVSSALDAECTEMLSWDTDVAKPARAAQIATLKTLNLAVIAPHQTVALPSHYTQGSLTQQLPASKQTIKVN